MDRERCGSSLIFQNVPHVKPVGERQRGNKEERERERESIVCSIEVEMCGWTSQFGDLMMVI